MALQGSMTFDNGITLSSAYLKVIEVCLKYGVNDNSAGIGVLIYKDKAAHDDGLPEVIEINHVVDDGNFKTYFSEAVLGEVGKTSLSQAYVYLKTLPQYSSLTEV